MTLDFTNLLLGSAFGIFIALLAWGDQIRKPRKEIMELEETFRKEFNLKKSVTNPLIRKSYNSMQSSNRYSFLQQTKSMIQLLENPSIKGENIKLLNQFRKLHGIRQQLETDYTFRYIFSIWLCVILYSFGIISIYTNELTFSLFNITIEFNIVLLFIVIIMIGVLIHNFFIVHKGEELFVNEIYSTDDRIEVKD
ncbi:hypothetical protein HYX19_03290 [Candidatus Woesearchaeota archaeon]|nr:hypothetical protein [Candidatus Woesearchaeota archaeon]MBI2673258.1 hypothetical protein [Candidatus Woesearchaeota archaeon]